MNTVAKLLRKFTVLFFGVPLGFVVIIGTYLGMFWESFKWGFQKQSNEVLDTLYKWEKE